MSKIVVGTSLYNEHNLSPSLEKIYEDIAEHIAAKNKKIVEERIGWNDDPLLEV